MAYPDLPTGLTDVSGAAHGYVPIERKSGGLTFFDWGRGVPANEARVTGYREPQRFLFAEFSQYPEVPYEQSTATNESSRTYSRALAAFQAAGAIPGDTALYATPLGKTCVFRLDKDNVVSLVGYEEPTYYFSSNSDPDAGPLISVALDAGEVSKGFKWTEYDYTTGELNRYIAPADGVRQNYFSPERKGAAEHIADSLLYAEADARGIVPNADNDQSDAINTYTSDMGDYGVVALRPGHYKLTNPWVVARVGQTHHIDGVSIDNTVAYEKLGTSFAGGCLTIDGQYREDGGPWIGVIERFLQETDRTFRVRNIKGVAYVGGGMFRPNTARAGKLWLFTDNVGIVGTVCTGDDGLLLHAISAVPAEYEPQTLSTIQSGGTGYRDGTYIGRTRTLTGSGVGAILGVVVESGVVIEAVVIDSGEGYVLGDTFTLDFPAECRDVNLNTMNANYDTAWAAYHDEIATADGDMTDAAVVSAKATFDAESVVEVGSGFVMSAGKTIDPGYYWNSNFSIQIMANDAYFAGWETRGKANYNQYNLYLERIHSRSYPHFIDREGVDNDYYFNVLVNGNFTRPVNEGVKIIDISSTGGAKIVGGRFGNPHVRSSRTPDWFAEIIDLGNSSWKKISAVAFCDDNQDREVFRVNKLMLNGFHEDSKFVAKETFLPTLTCTTPADLSITYLTQIGRRYRTGNWERLHVLIEATVTLNTASGTVEIGNLPIPVEEPPMAYCMTEGFDLRGTSRGVGVKLFTTEKAIVYEQNDSPTVARTGFPITEISETIPVVVEFTIEYEV